MPIVDDPYDFGRIAATNAASDVYAMGETPIMALALVGMPINVLPLETIGAIMRGGLLVACSPDIADQVLASFHSQGFGDAHAISRMRLAGSLTACRMIDNAQTLSWRQKCAPY